MREAGNDASGPNAAADIVEKAACRPRLRLARSSQTKTNDSPVKGPVLSATVADTIGGSVYRTGLDCGSCKGFCLFSEKRRIGTLDEVL